MDTYLLEFDMLRQKAESRMQMGAGFPDEFVSALDMQNAGLSKNAGIGQSGKYAGLLAGFISHAAFLWFLRLCVATGCTRSAGYGYGVRRRGF